MILLSYNENSITVLEGNADGDGLVRITEKTWDKFNDDYLTKKGRKIAHIITYCAHDYSGTDPRTCTKCGNVWNHEATLDTSCAGTYILKSGETGYVREWPYQASTLIRTITSSVKVSVVGSVKNSYNNMWYKLSDGNYIYSTHLALDPNSKPDTTLKVSDPVYPTDSLPLGQSFGLKGIISSNYTITNVSARIYDDCKIWLSYSKDWNSKSYNIASDGLNQEMTFKSLEVGSYVYEVSATDSSGTTKRLLYSTFSIAGSGAHTHDKGTYMFYEASHPHRNAYKCSVCGEVWADADSSNYVSICETCNPRNPVAPNAPTVSVNGQSVTVAWNDVANETGYDVYLVQEPWGWGDIKYTQYVSSNTTSVVFNGVADGYYQAFVIARPNDNAVQSPWSEVIVSASPSTAFLNLDGRLDVTPSDNIEGYGTADIYINGTLVADDWTDYWASWPVGTSYRITDIKPNPGYSYNGVSSGSAAGTVGESRTDVVLDFNWIDVRNIPEATDRKVFCGNIYLFFNAPVTWYTAKAYCEALGGHMVTISSVEENQFVWNLCGNGFTWIGGTDASGEGNWQWVTGEDFAYSNWYPGQPDNSLGGDEGGEHYLHLRLDDGLWNDNQGHVQFPFVCEIDSIPTYTVSYNANGGSGAPSAQTKTEGTALKLSTKVPTRSGYTFLGWAESSTATTPQYQPGDSFTKDAGTTLYAVWEINTYTISYNANGGSGAPSAQTKTEGTALKLSTKVPTRSGYTFLGWAESKTAATAKYQPGDRFTKDKKTTLYAVWQANPVTITKQPVSVTAESGAFVSYSVKATGENLRYQWQYWNGSGWSNTGDDWNSGTNTMSFRTWPGGNGLYFRCVVWNGQNGEDWAASDTVSLTVTPGNRVTITRQPVSVTAESGAFVSYRVEATGENLRYQWQYWNGTGWSNTGDDWNSATNTMSFWTWPGGNGLYFRCVVWNALNGEDWAASDTVSLTVTPGNKVTITRQPVSVAAKSGAFVSYRVEATGENLCYQWQYWNGSGWSNTGDDWNSGTNTMSFWTWPGGNGLYFRCVIWNGRNGEDWAASDTVSLAVS